MSRTGLPASVRPPTTRLCIHITMFWFACIWWLLMDGQPRLLPRFKVSQPVLWQHRFFIEKFCRPLVKMLQFLRVFSCIEPSGFATPHCNLNKTEQSPRSHFRELFREQGDGSPFRTSANDFSFPPGVSNVQLNRALFPQNFSFQETKLYFEHKASLSTISFSLDFFFFLSI